MNLFYESVFIVDEETHQEYLHRVNKEHSPKTPKERLQKRYKNYHHTTDKYGKILFRDDKEDDKVGNNAADRLDRISTMSHIRHKKSIKRGDTYSPH